VLVEIDRFLRRTGMTKSALGRHALGDASTVKKLFEGQRGLTEYTEKRLRRWMQDNPDGIPAGRPGRPPRAG
jgi:hypothetical protein